MTIQTINIGTAPNDNTGDDPRTAGQKLNSNFTTTTHAASRDVGIGTDQIPDSSQSYHIGNLNPNVFEGAAGTEVSGTAISASEILFKIKDSNISIPISVTITGNFDIINPDRTLNASGVIPQLALSSSGIGNVAVFAPALSGLTVGDNYWLRCNSSGSKIEVNF